MYLCILQLIRSDFSSLRSIDLAVGIQAWIYYSDRDIKKLQLHAVYNRVMYPYSPRTEHWARDVLSARSFCMDHTCHLFHPAWQQSRGKLIIIFV